MMMMAMLMTTISSTALTLTIIITTLARIMKMGIQNIDWGVAEGAGAPAVFPWPVGRARNPRAVPRYGAAHSSTPRGGGRHRLQRSG